MQETGRTNKARFLSKLLCMLLFVGCIDMMSLAQTVNGAFHGTVTDQSGAAVVGAKVTVTNMRHGQVRVATTDSRGFYTVAQEPPGMYSISASKAGFTTAIQSNIQLLVNQDVLANYQLQVGAVTQKVQVTSAPPMIRTTNATLGQVIGSRSTENLPLNGRQFTQLILLAPGAAPKEGGQQANLYVIPIAGGSISPSVNGQQPDENTFTLDGVLNNNFFYQASEISPPPDAIQEFNAQYHATDARFGISSGADVNVVTKSGGPQFHGDVYEFLRNSALDAPNYFDNFSHLTKPPYRQNQYGATIGGPVLLPHYDGRKKHTFFFGYWEGFRSDEVFTQLANVPTSEELSGNFSDLLTGTPTGATDDLGRPIMKGQLYNPYSSRQVTAGQPDPVTGLMATTSGLVRDPFPGNIVPSTLISPQALTYIHAFYPAANFGPGGNSFPNFTDHSRQLITSDQFGVGMDHTFSNSDILSGHFFYTEPTETIPYALLVGAPTLINHARLLELGYTHIFSPTLLMELHYGYNWFNTNRTDQPAGLALAQETGLEQILEEQDNVPFIAQVGISPRFTGTEQGNDIEGPMRTHQVNLDVAKTAGSNSLSAGILYMHIHAISNGWDSNVSFDQYPSSGISQGNTNQAASGDGLASMLLNLPSSFAESAGNTQANVREFWLGAYLQDKWQATRKLNVTLGVRWDFASPPHYLHDQFSAWNSACPTNQRDSTPGEIAAIEQACILMPVAYVPEPTPANPTPLSWPVPNVRSSIWEPKYDGWQPRLGIAYAMTRKAVIRTGFVVYDDHNHFFEEVQGSRGAWPFALQSRGGPLNSSLNRGIPTDFFNNLPSTTSFLQGSTPVSSVAENPNSPIAYSMEYNFGIDYQATQDMALSVDYVGSGSRHLWMLYTYNQPLPSEMGPNAFPNALPFPFLKSTLAGEGNFYTSNYDGLELKLQQRVTSGLSFLASYTFSKCLDEASGQFSTTPQNAYDIKGSYGPCDFNYPQLFSFSGVYLLPFGQGQMFANHAGRVMNNLISGWHVANITQIQSGSPFNVDISGDNANSGTTQRPNFVPGCQVDPSGFVQNVEHWSNPACYAIAAPFTFGNLGRNTLRGPGYVDADISLYKNFKFLETKTFQFRTDFFNTFNHANFAPPGGSPGGSFADLGGSSNTAVNGATFMRILSAAPARQIQFSAKLTF